MEKRCICIGAGEFKEKTILVHPNDFVIAVDGGYQHCLDIGIKVDLVVSDFDSYQKEIDKVEVKRSSPVKDDTDMLLALHEGMSRGYSEFVLYGAMGGRIEHTLANIQCLKYLCENNAHGVMISENSMIDVRNFGCAEYDEHCKGYISVFSLTDQSIISIDNLKYPLDHKTITTSYPLGIDNEFIQKKSKITIHKGCICIIKSEE